MDDEGVGPGVEVLNGCAARVLEEDPEPRSDGANELAVVGARGGDGDQAGGDQRGEEGNAHAPHTA